MVVMVRDLAVAIVMFTVASYAGVLSSGSASAAKLVGALLVLAWLAALVRRPRSAARSLLSMNRPVVACASGLLAWSLISGAWALSPHVAVAGAGRWLQDLILLPIVFAGVTRFGHVRWVMIAFVAGALLAVLYGLASGATVDGSRLASALDDPNETAAVLVAAAVLAVALGASERRPFRRLFAYMAALAAVLGVAATASRGGLVALGVAAVAAVLFGGRWRGRVALLAAAGALLVAGWFVLLAPAGSRAHVSNLQTGRTTLWTVAERAIEANPVIGVGNDNYTIAAKDYLVRPGATTDAQQVVIDPKVAHDMYLELWADLGIVGLLIFAGLVLFTLRAALTAIKALSRAGRRDDEVLARAVVVAIIAMLGADFFISDLYSKQLFLLLAVAASLGSAALGSGVLDSAALGSVPVGSAPLGSGARRGAER
jgi:O-antigen ligase